MTSLTRPTPATRARVIAGPVVTPIINGDIARVVERPKAAGGSIGG
jgi:hypothetical protein